MPQQFSRNGLSPLFSPVYDQEAFAQILWIHHLSHDSSRSPRHQIRRERVLWQHRSGEQGDDWSHRARNSTPWVASAPPALTKTTTTTTTKATTSVRNSFQQCYTVSIDCVWGTFFASFICVCVVVLKKLNINSKFDVESSNWSWKRGRS